MYSFSSNDGFSIQKKISLVQENRSELAISFLQEIQAFLNFRGFDFHDF